jgi:hypothetical protein
MHQATAAAAHTARGGWCHARGRVSQRRDRRVQATKVAAAAAAAADGGDDAVLICSEEDIIAHFKDDDGDAADAEGDASVDKNAGVALEAWMNTHEGFDACGVGVAWLGDARGYGGVVANDVDGGVGITAGDVLVRVPRAAMLTSEEARACPHVGDACASLSEWQALTLKLLHERDVHLGRVVTPGGCQIGYVEHTGCHQLVF